MTKVVFRVDAGQILHVAMGHAFRCMSLAEELRSDNSDIVFVMREEVYGNDAVRSRGFDVQVLPRELTPAEEIAFVSSLKPDLVVFDLMAIENWPTKILREEGITTVILDDLGGKELIAELIVNGNVVQSAQEYTGTFTRALLGPAYSIMGPQFDNRRNERRNPTIQSVLVTLGGADPLGYTSLVVDLLVENHIGKDITVIKGPAFGDRAIQENDITSMKTQVRVQENVPDLSMLMVAADLVVSAGGRTAYELAATGTPCVLVPTAIHELAVAQKFVAAGAALAVSDVSEDCLKSELVPLIRKTSDLETRRRMADAGRGLVDGGGRQRVAKAIRDLSLCRVGKGGG